MESCYIPDCGSKHDFILLYGVAKTPEFYSEFMPYNLADLYLDCYEESRRVCSKHLFNGLLKDLSFIGLPELVIDREGNVRLDILQRLEQTFRKMKPQENNSANSANPKQIS